MITTNLNLVVEALKREEIVAIPTETVYGLAGNVYSDVALQKIFQLKKRPFNNPLIAHVKSIDELTKLATDIPLSAFKLAEKFWPGPLTLVLNKQEHISNWVTGGKNTIAVRMPNHPVALQLLNSLDFPLAAPSANPFGSISPTSAIHVLDYFKDELEIILEGGDCEAGIESTIIGFEKNEPVLYRHGSISIQEIEEVIGKLNFNTKNEIDPNAPGMFSRHYAPTTDTYLTNNVEALIKSFNGKRVGLLLFDKPISNKNIQFQEVLSVSRNMKEAAKNLYGSLHRLDRLNLDLIIAEKLPEVGLGISINDRLQRAIQKT